MNLVKEFLLLKAKVDKLYCQLIAKGSDEQDPTVPNHVKNIKQEDINNWNKVKDTEDVKVQITENNHFAEIGQNQKDFNKNVSDYKVIIDNKNIEQDDRLENLEGENVAQYDLIKGLGSDLESERTRNDIQDSMLGDFEGGLAAKLDKGTYTGDASDLKSLIDTKADLDGGKVPKAQSQPSTIVMNNSTYVITFTDATGAVQTIDLPLESLFKDANYNSSTKSLIVTLQDGTTRTIPLTDLVDLPEIVLATTNPAVTPTTGQKVYFNTSLGKVWFNVSGAWVFGGNLISDSEKNNLTTAYNHSQTTGNVHGTKLEELSDIGSETTTIADTDIILKKETGGFWKKITFANFKSWFTTALAKKINIGLDTIFNFKNISAMTLTDFRSITPNIETIYFTEEQNSTGWQQFRTLPNYYFTIGGSIEKTVELLDEQYIELDSDSTFNLIDVANTKIKGIFENDFVIITFRTTVETPSTANQWFKVILKINGVQTAVSPAFFLTETSGKKEQIAHNFALNVTPEMVTYGATLHLKGSTTLTYTNIAITVARVHKSTSANL